MRVSRLRIHFLSANLKFTVAVRKEQSNSVKVQVIRVITTTRLRSVLRPWFDSGPELQVQLVVTQAGRVALPGLRELQVGNYHASTPSMRRLS